jgi:hypothetical protein
MQQAQELMQTSGTDLLQTVVEQAGQMKETLVGVLQDMTQLDAVQDSFEQDPNAGPITNGQSVMPTDGEPVMPTASRRRVGGWDQQPRPEIVEATMQALAQGERPLEEVGGELQERGWPVEDVEKAFDEGLEKGLWDISKKGMDLWLSLRPQVSTGSNRTAEWESADAFGEIMDNYDQARERWIQEKGTDEGFDEWFTDQTMNPNQAARYSGDPHWITAKYPSTCAKCNRQIQQGEEVFYYPNGKQIYCNQEGCGQEASRDFDATSFDEDFGAMGAKTAFEEGQHPRDEGGQFTGGGEGGGNGEDSGPLSEGQPMTPAGGPQEAKSDYYGLIENGIDQDTAFQTVLQDNPQMNPEELRSAIEGTGGDRHLAL